MCYHYKHPMARLRGIGGEKSIHDSVSALPRPYRFSEQFPNSTSRKRLDTFESAGILMEDLVAAKEEKVMPRKVSSESGLLNKRI
jgi:hypothetical protein